MQFTLTWWSLLLVPVLPETHRPYLYPHSQMLKLITCGWSNVVSWSPIDLPNLVMFAHCATELRTSSTETGIYIATCVYFASWHLRLQKLTCMVWWPYTTFAKCPFFLSFFFQLIRNFILYQDSTDWLCVYTMQWQIQKLQKVWNKMHVVYLQVRWCDTSVVNYQWFLFCGWQLSVGVVICCICFQYSCFGFYHFETQKSLQFVSTTFVRKKSFSVQCSFKSLRSKSQCPQGDTGASRLIRKSSKIGEFGLSISGQSGTHLDLSFLLNAVESRDATSDVQVFNLFVSPSSCLHHPRKVQNCNTQQLTCQLLIVTFTVRRLAFQMPHLQEVQNFSEEVHGDPSGATRKAREWKQSFSSMWRVLQVVPRRQIAQKSRAHSQRGLWLVAPKSLHCTTCIGVFWWTSKHLTFYAKIVDMVWRGKREFVRIIDSFSNQTLFAT